MCVNLSASALSDYTRLKPFLVVMLCAFLLGAYGLATLEQTSGYWMLVLGFGAGGGLWGVLSNLVFVRQFGILHLGEISGLNTSITVLSSAIGPVVFSLANDFRWRLSLSGTGLYGAARRSPCRIRLAPAALGQKAQFSDCLTGQLSCSWGWRALAYSSSGECLM